MKGPTDPKEKTSRRSFAKTAATALVAVPIVSSLSSCAQPQSTTSPTPQPSPKPDKELVYSGNPPVIIDGGSLQVSSPATLMRVNDTESTPKNYAHKFIEKNKATVPLRAIKEIRITNDYGDVLLRRELQSSETVKVWLWIQKVSEGGKGGNDDQDTDTAQYDGIANQNVPEVIIQGGELEIRSDKRLPGTKKLFKSQGRNQKRSDRHDWDDKDFRIGQVKVFIGNSTDPIYTSPPAEVEKGLRIILIFP